ncbi:1-phosphofructokinase/tagatose 6-phosphate kinase [Abditibacterium utsteinense]|uniref:1-phosphofructokinase/tagatose 6-phosphate kinase n=1 Tax=Abditibacterium utsteinense TaxID=1960156 RepID=A0A2S8SWV3_9BACT|nr:PfkB family carbohydrate kinase [Abditibacterium utsteinense]PQV65282.1 1-phosphofructokinase/tagatose 6-phosphate kinase [Abditibacterium utsteinense]
MFLTLTPNPCIERTLRVSSLTAGTSQRLDEADVLVSAGGKGINAARVAARFGAPSTAIAVVGRRQLTYLREIARDEGICADFLSVESDTRVCLNMVHGDGTNTEIIENGAPFSLETGTGLLQKWHENLPGARLAAIGGAYPPCSAAAFAGHAAILCQMAHAAGVPVIYDGRGEALQRALSGKTPLWAIKPNLQEAAQILGRTLETRADERRAVRDLRAKGAEVVLLSCGSRGLYIGHREGIEWLPAPRVETVSAVGCGDALVGAFAARWLQGDSLFEAARWGVAAGSACAAQIWPAFVSQAQAANLLPWVRPQTEEIALQIQ